MAPLGDAMDDNTAIIRDRQQPLDLTETPHEWTNILLFSFFFFFSFYTVKCISTFVSGLARKRKTYVFLLVSSLALSFINQWCSFLLSHASPAYRKTNGSNGGRIQPKKGFLHFCIAHVICEARDRNICARMRMWVESSQVKSSVVVTKEEKWWERKRYPSKSRKESVCIVIKATTGVHRRSVGLLHYLHSTHRKLNVAFLL